MFDLMEIIIMACMAVFISLILWAAVLYKAPKPPPLKEGKCSVTGYSSDEESKYLCAYQDYWWNCSPWKCTRGQLITGEAK